MRVLALSNFPRSAAATRFRIEQFIDPLHIHGIEVDVRPFLRDEQFRGMYTSRWTASNLVGIARSITDRVGDAFSVRNYDLLFVQREAMFFGPEIFERLFQSIGRLPMVLDLDDATYVPYVSPSYGRLGSYLKFFGKTDRLIHCSHTVVCGNRFIAEYVASKGTKAVVIPTVVDTNIFAPVTRSNTVPVIGWIGTPSTFKVLESIFPVIQNLARKHRFVFKVIGSGREPLKIEGVEVFSREWQLSTEVSDFQSIDIGLYPITVTESMPSDWIIAKSGFKAIQYFALGIPFVMSPVGICAEIGIPNVTHLTASTDEEWFQSLDRLLTEEPLRKQIGDAGREHSLRNYQLSEQTTKLIEVLESAANPK